MYTVLRFCGRADKIEDIGQHLNVIAPGTYTRPDRVGGRFSCVISEGDSWQEHRDKLEEKISQFAQVIERAHSFEFALEIDIAIEPEDYGARRLTEVSLDEDLLRTLEHHRISVSVSVYGLGDM